MDRHIKTRLCALLVVSSLAQSSLHAMGDWIPGDGIGGKVLVLCTVGTVFHHWWTQYGKYQRRAARQQSKMDLPARLMALQARTNWLESLVAVAGTKAVEKTIFERVAATEDAITGLGGRVGKLENEVPSLRTLINNHGSALVQLSQRLDTLGRAVTKAGERGKRVQSGLKGHMKQQGTSDAYKEYFPSESDFQKGRLERKNAERREKK